MIQNRTTLKTYFETGDTPTQAQFENLIDSCLNLSGETLTQDFQADTDGNAFSILHGNFNFEMRTDMYGPYPILSAAIKNGFYFNGMLDTSSLGESNQVISGYLDAANGELVGLTVRELADGNRFASLSAREDTGSGYEMGFSAWGFQTANPTADHYCYDNALGKDIGGTFVTPGQVRGFAAYSIADGDNWTENNYYLNQSDGFKLSVGAVKTAGSLGAGANVFQVKSGHTVTKKKIVIDDNAEGFVLKSPNGHYWMLKVDNSGVITTTDLGTSY